MWTADAPIDLPTLRVDSAVWQQENGQTSRDDSRLTAHLTLGELSVRLEARAIGSGADREPAYGSEFAQRTRIGDRAYVVVGFEERPALAGASA